MDRRTFALRAATGAAVALAGPANAMATTDFSGGLFENPAQHIGQTYALRHGASVKLVRADRVEGDPRLEQWRLHFESSDLLAEGIHTLSGPSAPRPVDLFLQCHGRNAVACTSRLA